MPRPRSLRPGYCRDRTTDRAYVVIDGKRTYLGRFSSPENRDKYDVMIAEWISRGRCPDPTAVATPDAPPLVTVAHIIAAFWAHGSRAPGGTASAWSARPRTAWDLPPGARC